MPSQSIRERLSRSASWLKDLPPEEWSVYKAVMRDARRSGLQFAVGGGFATMAYTGLWRDTKDIDFFILESDKEKMVRILSNSGLEDYYSQQPYQRHWIYRSYKRDVIVDAIWAMANQRAVVDEAWFQGPGIEFDGERLGLVPTEETLWSKLYVLQHDRCDWPDGLNLLYSAGPELDWQRLIKRISGDTALLTALLSIFGWLCPDRARDLPDWLWEELHAPRPDRERPLEGQARRAVCSIRGRGLLQRLMKILRTDKTKEKKFENADRNDEPSGARRIRRHIEDGR